MLEGVHAQQHATGQLQALRSAGSGRRGRVQEGADLCGSLASLASRDWLGLGLGPFLLAQEVAGAEREGEDGPRQAWSVLSGMQSCREAWVAAVGGGREGSCCPRDPPGQPL